MRLGDLDLAEKAIEENLNIAPCDRFAAMDEVRDTPTIDPEGLPIVQQLRAEVERLNAEIADREKCSIEQHSNEHYWRERCRNAEETIKGCQRETEKLLIAVNTLREETEKLRELCRKIYHI